MHLKNPDLSSVESLKTLGIKADFNVLKYAYSEPVLHGQLKVYPEDFRVEEILLTQLTGEGEHLWCWVEKRGQNTDWVARELAKWAGTARHNVGFAGQKDRQAVTKQWFSIQLPGKADPDPSLLEVEGVTILKMQRHKTKIQRGALEGNHFTLILRDIRPVDMSMTHAEIHQELESRLLLIKNQGVPNYFGEQRFGRDGNNLAQGEKLLLSESSANDRRKKRGAKRKGGNQNQQSLYISALRSWMFNDLLSQRIQQQTWNKVLPGDILHTNNTSLDRLVASEQDLESHQKAVLEGNTSPTGGLFGDGVLPTQAEALAIENAIVEKYQAWCHGLAQNRVKQDRRSLILRPVNLQWSFEDQAGQQSMQHSETINNECSKRSNLQISFSLPAGSFATMVLREILKV